MKILSISKWKTAGEDWMINAEYSQAITDELRNRGDEIISSDRYRVEVRHKMGDRIIPLSIRVHEGSGYGDYVLMIFNSGGQEITLADGDSAVSAINNMDRNLGIILQD